MNTKTSPRKSSLKVATQYLKPTDEIFENPKYFFLLEFIEHGMTIFSTMGTWTIIHRESAIVMLISKRLITLECIVTKPRLRKKGHGSELLNFLTKIADKYNITISLKTNLFVKKDWLISKDHPVIKAGEKGTAPSLPKLTEWFQKFGFEKDETITPNDYLMRRNPASRD